MGKIIKILGTVLLLAALAGGVYLASKSQELRRGATAAEPKPRFYTAKTNFDVNETFDATLALDTTAANMYLSAGELYFKFDQSKLQVESMNTIVFDESLATNAYAKNACFFKKLTGDDPDVLTDTVVTKTFDNTTGKITFTIASVRPYTQLASNIVYLAKIKFKAIASGTATLDLDTTKASTGAIAELTGGNYNLQSPAVTSGDHGSYVIGGSTPTNTVAPTNTIAPTNTGVPTTCTDSDNGKNYTIKGTTSETQNGNTTQRQDQCVSGTLEEFYCSQGERKSEYHVCTANEECNDGKCVQKEATVTPNPTPTVPPAGTDPVLRFKMSFSGVNQGAQCANWPVQVMVKGSDNTTKTYNGINLTKTNETKNQLAVYMATVSLTGFTQKDNLAVFVKGPRHLQTKYGKDGQTEFYGVAGGEISGLTTSAETTPLFDFTGYPLMAGDISGEASGVQDGTADGLDFSYMKSEVAKNTSVNPGQSLGADTNGNCSYELQDVALFMMALKEKQEQLY